MTQEPQTLIVIAASAVGVVLIVQSILLWRLRRSLGGVARLDEKLGHFGDALSLLTETTESGFRAVATEIDRVTVATAANASRNGASRAASGAKERAAAVSDGAVRDTVLGNALKKVLPNSNARINAAVRRGRTVSEIAAAEELSEGEVRLRLHLAKQAAQARSAAQTRRTRTTQEQQHGTVRA